MLNMVQGAAILRTKDGLGDMKASSTGGGLRMLNLTAGVVVTPSGPAGSNGVTGYVSDDECPDLVRMSQSDSDTSTESEGDDYTTGHVPEPVWLGHDAQPAFTSAKNLSYSRPVAEPLDHTAVADHGPSCRVPILETVVPLATAVCTEGPGLPVTTLQFSWETDMDNGYESDEEYPDLVAVTSSDSDSDTESEFEAEALMPRVTVDSIAEDVPKPPSFTNERLDERTGAQPPKSVNEAVVGEEDDDCPTLVDITNQATHTRRARGRRPRSTVRVRYL